MGKDQEQPPPSWQAIKTLERRALDAEFQANEAEKRAAKAEQRAMLDEPQMLQLQALRSMVNVLSALEGRIAQGAETVVSKADDAGGKAAADLLYGMPAIAAHLGLKIPQARHLSDRGHIPTFKLPGNKNTCARRSALKAWLAQQEVADGKRS